MLSNESYKCKNTQEPNLLSPALFLLLLSAFSVSHFDNKDQFFKLIGHTLVAISIKIGIQSTI